jgi:hypothetical protein
VNVLESLAYISNACATVPCDHEASSTHSHSIVSSTCRYLKARDVVPGRADFTVTHTVETPAWER